MISIDSWPSVPRLVLERRRFWTKWGDPPVKVALQWRGRCTEFGAGFGNKYFQQRWEMQTWPFYSKVIETHRFGWRVFTHLCPVGSVMWMYFLFNQALWGPAGTGGLTTTWVSWVELISLCFTQKMSTLILVIEACPGNFYSQACPTRFKAAIRCNIQSSIHSVCATLAYRRRLETVFFSDLCYHRSWNF